MTLEWWEQAVAAWLDGRADDLPAVLGRWQSWHPGLYRGQVDRTALPEPYMGDLGDAVAAVLSLSPGPARPEFQHRDGIFADEIRKLGSYRAWAATAPFLRDPWETRVGINRHHRDRLTFLHRWYQDDTIAPTQMLVFQLYPWHADGQPPAKDVELDILQQMVFDPIRNAGVRDVFAFGADWVKLANDRLCDRIVDVLGAGGRDIGSRVPSRTLVVGQTSNGLCLHAFKHSGSDKPPAADEVTRFRDAHTRCRSGR